MIVESNNSTNYAQNIVDIWVTVILPPSHSIFHANIIQCLLLTKCNIYYLKSLYWQGGFEKVYPNTAITVWMTLMRYRKNFVINHTKNLPSFPLNLNTKVSHSSCQVLCNFACCKE